MAISSSACGESPLTATAPTTRPSNTTGTPPCNGVSQRQGRDPPIPNLLLEHAARAPVDLVYRSDGALFFTDPPFGLPQAFADARKELSFSGVYMLRDGVVRLLTRELDGPNGLAFSPDERYLYVGNWDESRKIVMRYEVSRDGTVSDPRLFFDMTTAPGEDAIDGIKVDAEGNFFISRLGGIWVVSAEGRHFGTIGVPRHVLNMAWAMPTGIVV